MEWRLETSTVAVLPARVEEGARLSVGQGNGGGPRNAGICKCPRQAAVMMRSERGQPVSLEALDFSQP